MPSTPRPPRFVALTVRMPVALHRKLTKVAERELRSVNREIVTAVQAHVTNHEGRGSR